MNIAALERDLLKKTGEASSLLEKTMATCQAHQTKDESGKVISTGRPMTVEEKAAIQALLDEGNAIKAKVDAAKSQDTIEAQLNRLVAGAPTPFPGIVPHQPRHLNRSVRSLGQQFVEAEGMMEFFKTGGHRRSSTWRSPSAELGYGDLNATTLTEDSGSGGQLIVSDYRPGIVSLLFKRLVVADLLASGSTDSSNITYMKETTFTNAAAAVAEGGTKPESTLIFEQVNDLVKKIAHWLPVTDEMLEDVAQIRSYIDSRLRLGLDLTEEDQLLNGSGTGSNLLGLMNRTGLAADQAQGADTNADAIHKQITAISTTAFVMPDGVVINPTNWQTIALSKDTQGQYYGAGPFAPMQAKTLWGLPVVPTPSMTVGTALVGAYKTAAQVFRKGGVRVEASNSHADFFVKNLVAILAEERVALAVYRPGAFGKVTGLD